MKQICYLGLVLVVLVPLCTADQHASADEDNNQMEGGSKRNPKVLSVFQVVTFPNAPCNGGSRNGTCFTAEECNSKGGSTSGTCAQGFGVCCIVSLSCGGTSNVNCTYIVQTSTTTNPSSTTNGACDYKICPCSSDICRIRFDFNTFVIADQQTSSTAATTTGASAGDCITDSFSITSPGNVGTPVICGFNSGQHMILDASDECHTVSFDIGGATATRNWDIKVTQYSCTDNNGGPDGCLQYFTGTSGTVANYGYPTTATAIGTTVTHLSSQLYNMCFRQERGFCAICYSPHTIPGTPALGTASSYGLSGPDAAPVVTGTTCIQDYLEIPEFQAAGIATGTIPVTGVSRLCGRVFATTGTATATVCSYMKPFRMLFKTSDDELIAESTAGIAAGDGAGYQGFYLDWWLTSC